MCDGIIIFCNCSIVFFQLGCLIIFTKIMNVAYLKVTFSSFFFFLGAGLLMSFHGHSCPSIVIICVQGTGTGMVCQILFWAAGIAPSHWPQYEELVEVVTCAVAKLNNHWPAEFHVEPQRGKLSKRFLRVKSPPPHRNVTFFPSSRPRCWGRGLNLFGPPLRPLIRLLR